MLSKNKKENLNQIGNEKLNLSNKKKQKNKNSWTACGTMSQLVIKPQISLLKSNKIHHD